MPRTEMRARDGVEAHEALVEAGPRPLDHVSSAIAKVAKLEVSATADPCEEPEAYGAARKSGLYGLSERPYSPRCIPPLAIGGMLVLPRQIAPAPRSRLMVNASCCATTSANAGLPAAAV